MSTEIFQDAFSSLKFTKEADISKTREAMVTDNAGEIIKNNYPISALLDFQLMNSHQE